MELSHSKKLFLWYHCLMNKYVKILIIVVVLVLVGLMYFLKNAPEKGNPSTPGTAASVTAPASVQKSELEPVSEPEEMESENSAPMQKEATEEERIPMEFFSFDEEFFFSQGIPVMLDFGSASCGPCQMMKPELVAFYEESYGKVLVQYADVWEDPSLTGGYPVSAVPTQFFFTAEGKPYSPSEEVVSRIRLTQYTYKDTGEHALTAHIGYLSKDEMYMIFRDMGVDL